MQFSSFRKLDYLIFYLISAIPFIVQLANISLGLIIGILVCSTIPSLILGTITNLIFKKKAK